MTVLYSPREVRIMAHPDQADASVARSKAFAARRGTTVYAASDRPIEDARNDDLCGVVRDVADGTTTTIVVASKVNEMAQEKIIYAAVVDNTRYRRDLAGYSEQELASGMSLIACEEGEHYFLDAPRGAYIRPIPVAHAGALADAFSSVVEDISKGAVVKEAHVRSVSYELSPQDIKRLSSNVIDTRFRWAQPGLSCASYDNDRVFISLDNVESPSQSAELLAEALSEFAAWKDSKTENFIALVTDGENVISCAFSSMGEDGAEVSITEQEFWKGEKFGRYDAHIYDIRYIARVVVRSLAWQKQSAGFFSND